MVIYCHTHGRHLEKLAKALWYVSPLLFPKYYMEVPMDSDGRLKCMLTCPLGTCASFTLAS